MTQITSNERLQFYTMDAQAHQQTFAQDVAHGLAAPQKWLPPKYFYDERGSQLYEQICDLPEYYPYRAERDIFMAHAAEIHAEIGHLPLVEFGSGSCHQDALPPGRLRASSAAVYVLPGGHLFHHAARDG